MPESEATPHHTAFDWRIYADATCAGLTALVPLPFVDLAFEAYFRRRMPATIAKVRHRELTDEARRRFGRGIGRLISLEGCLAIPLGVIRYIVKKIWRKVVYVFAVADATTQVSAYWQRAYLLDHIISAAIRGMDRATLEYPVKPGLILCLDRAFPVHLNEIIVEKAIAYRDRGVVGIDIAGPESSTFDPADYKAAFKRARKKGLGITVHTGESGPVGEVAEVIRHLEPDRLGHGVKSAYDEKTLGILHHEGWHQYLLLLR